MADSLAGLRALVTDVGAAIVFLASPAARFVNGQAFAVDGHTETLSTR